MMTKLKHNTSEDCETDSLNGMMTIRERSEEGHGCVENLINYFVDFCKNTKIYGFQYLGDPKLVRIEKLYWFIFIFISFYFSITTVVHVWTKWNNVPVTVFAQNYKSVWEVPFPAITICPETKIRQTVYNFTDYYHKIAEAQMGEGNLTANEIERFSDMSLFCDNHLHFSGKRITDFKTVYEHLNKVAPSFKSVFFGCKWCGLNNDCKNLFTPILTEEGLCFTFNMLNKKELFLNDVAFLQANYTDNEKHSAGWTIDDGYSKNTGKNTYPRRTATPGTKGGLFVLLKTNDEDIDYVCRGPVEGFRIAFHHPSEMPKIGTEYIRAPLNQEVVIAVKPTLVTANENLKKSAPLQRQCFFSEERKLKFFRTYNHQNCRIECLANFTLRQCDCVAFHMPHEEATKICGSGSNGCMSKAEQELLTLEAEQDTSSFNFENEKPLCHCLPACTSLSYNVETSQAKLNWPKVLQGFKNSIDAASGMHMTRLTIFFKDMHFTSSERNIYDETVLLAQCGGLLAFFCGLSFLSLAEIIYFLSLRIVCNVKKFGKPFWAGN